MFKFINRKSDEDSRSEQPAGAQGKKTDIVREHILFRGSVQGVGFRYTAYHLAQELRMTGWVKNNYDGSVECEIQGKTYEIEQFLAKLSMQRWISIDEMERETISTVPDESSFHIIGY